MLASADLADADFESGVSDADLKWPTKLDCYEMAQVVLKRGCARERIGSMGCSGTLGEPRWGKERNACYGTPYPGYEE